MHADPIAPADPAVLRDELVRRWTERPYVEDDPNCYELNEFGEWIVTPRATHGHQEVAGEIVVQLVRQLGPRATMEVSVYTDRGTGRSVDAGRPLARSSRRRCAQDAGRCYPKTCRTAKCSTDA
jgi:hypothetical protein